MAYVLTFKKPKSCGIDRFILLFIFIPPDTKDMLRKLLDEIVSLEVYFSLCYKDFMLLSF